MRDLLSDLTVVTNHKKQLSSEYADGDGSRAGCCDRAHSRLLEDRHG